MEYNTAGTCFVIFMFSILVLCSIVGNLLVMYVIVKCRALRTVTNYFLFNLSAGDLLTIFQIVPNVHYVLTRDWIFGLSLCRLSQFFTSFNIAISVFTFIGITADRWANNKKLYYFPSCGVLFINAYWYVILPVSWQCIKYFPIYCN